MTGQLQEFATRTFAQMRVPQLRHPGVKVRPRKKTIIEEMEKREEKRRKEKKRESRKEREEAIEIIKRLALILQILSADPQFRNQFVFRFAGKFVLFFLFTSTSPDFFFCRVFSRMSLGQSLSSAVVLLPFPAPPTSPAWDTPT